ncbi:MAG TPA: HAD hydrolase-like protein [Longimicrobiaceae bacterium]|nr:HAD hydrolase-like protein [Longimicrobiaceae bacterium]
MGVVQRLILFDIDGTMLSTAGQAGGAFREALSAVYGVAGPWEGYSFAGKTDPQIAHDLLRLSGLARETVERGLPDVWEHYLAGLEERLRGVRVELLPGVRPLVERLHASPRAVLGLLTGNVREGARLKLTAAGLDFRHFAVGAFGSDHAERRELPALAIYRAEERFGHRFQGKEVVIIGDTPFDISCGERLGVRTLAVATGSYSHEELARCSPDHLFPSLRDTEAVWRAIFD